ncbi:BRO-N domain-containing protein [Moorella sp. E306M]|uniref:BRO-N domain-containing protein n=1 Tax=Moorella sp. E306M TaxID=2572683 RepID=UPI001C0EC9CA|nr:BRO family protein [Moorella sp. E306M]
MSNLVLIKSANFGNVQCDFYSDNKEIWMTREQIGRALEYADPGDAIRKIHERNRDRLDRFSVTVKLSGTDGKLYDTYLYSARGVYEICRWSRQPKADAFYDFVYDILESLRTGQTQLTHAGKQIRPFKTPEQIQLELETKARNARVREANLYRRLAKEFRKQLSEQSIQQLVGLAAAVAHGKPILPITEIEKTYSAEDIAREAGVSANKVGRIANQYGLKTAEYGISILDKSRYSNKQVATFRYNEKGRARLLEVLGKRGKP